MKHPSKCTLIPRVMSNTKWLLLLISMISLIYIWYNCASYILTSHVVLRYDKVRQDNILYGGDITNCLHALKAGEMPSMSELLHELARGFKTMTSEFQWHLSPPTACWSIPQNTHCHLPNGITQWPPLRADQSGNYLCGSAYTWPWRRDIIL